MKNKKKKKPAAPVVMTAEQFSMARKLFGVTQEVWGEMIGVGREHVADIERGTVQITVTMAKLIWLLLKYELPKKAA